jgi:hypothetical protein
MDRLFHIANEEGKDCLNSLVNYKTFKLKSKLGALNIIIKKRN